MKTKWNLKLLYTSTKDPQIKKDIEKSKKNVSAFVKKWENNDTYLKDAAILREALDEYEKLNSTTGLCDRPRYYFLLLNNLDQTNTEVKGELNKIEDISIKLGNNIQFFELSISKVNRKQQKIFLKSEELKEYKHFLETLFRSSQYLLSDKEEKIFNLISKTSHSNWVDMVSELTDKQKLDIEDENGKRIEVTYNDIKKYINSKNKRVRDIAAKEFNKVNSRYAEIAEFEINSVLEHKKISDEYRGVPRPDLTRHIGDDIDSAVVDTLVDTVTKNFHISRKYYKRKAELLNQKTLGYEERNVPLGEIDSHYVFKDSIRLVENTFNRIDKEFGKIVKNFSKNGQYDVFAKQGKTGGAFCINISKNLPTYILLNFNERLSDVLTIAHESGHGIHAELSKKQNALNNGHPISLAEIASTFFEDFVLEEIMKTANNELRFAVLAEKINSDVSSIFRQVAFYNFEKELHKEFRKRGYLEKEYISDLFCKHMKAYLGDYVDEDEGMRNGWIYVSHFRRFFYVYSYSSGLLISKALQSMVKEDSRDIRFVKEFLSSGSSKSPYEIFNGMGIDITKKEIWEKGLEEVERLLTLI